MKRPRPFALAALVAAIVAAQDQTLDPGRGRVPPPSPPTGTTHQK